jgi:multicomponent Na+:H+ antiporter subunit F
MTGPETFLALAGQASMVMLLAGMALMLFRLAKGPGAPDRIVALDLMSVLVVAFLVVFSIHSGEASYLDVAIAYACIAFLGTLALVRYAGRERGGRPPSAGAPGPSDPGGGPSHD